MMDIESKSSQRELERIGSDNDGSSTNGSTKSVSPPSRFINERALLLKIDFRLIPILMIVYITAFLDRVNISNAMTLGLPEELGLTGTQGNVALAIFFVPYIVLEIPCNLILKRVKPRIWLAACAFSFGIITIVQGFVRNYSGLLATRFFLGVAEAGMYPGCFYMISMWYKREEAQKRFTAFFCATALAQAFGGLIAGGIANMDGIQNLSGWRWVFIIEGLATCLIAVLGLMFIVDFPDQVKWLTEHERSLVMSRVQEDAAEDEMKARTKTSGAEIKRFFSTLEPYAAGLMYFGILVPSYSLAYFIPTVVRNLGYGRVQTQLHAVLPIAAGLAFAVLIAIASDYFRTRYPFVLLCSFISLAGTLLLMNVRHHFAAQYAGLSLVSMGVQGAVPMAICWFTMNLKGNAQRSVGTAWIVAFGNLGGLLATFTYLEKERPVYRTGYLITVVCTCVSVLGSSTYAVLVVSERKKSGARLIL